MRESEPSTPDMGKDVPLSSSETDLSPVTDLVHQWVGESAAFRAVPMPGGASTRLFYRVHVDGTNRSAVAFYVPDATRSDEIDKTDGARHRWPFVEVHELLETRGVRVPSILADGSDRGWLLVEDLGDDTLAAYLTRLPAEKEAIYRVAVRDLARAQQALCELPESSVIGRRAFDEDLLEWEIQHFREWALDARQMSFADADRATFDAIAKRLAARISGWTRGFVHRDYQSRNLMVREADTGAELVWIDFQDALLGPRVYDLVALLNDSYQTFDRAFVEARIDEFGEALGVPANERGALVREFDLVTVQRKLKDAGRFVFIDRVKNNPSFLQFVEPTIEKARASLARLEDDEDMRALGALIDRTLRPLLGGRFAGRADVRWSRLGMQGAQSGEGSGERRIGAVLAGRFRLEGRLGRGGFGEVWRASELLPDGSVVREVALKLMTPDQVPSDWAREARVLASLRHPSLVTIFSAGILETTPPSPFVAMELLEGPTLSAIAHEKGTIPWRRALFLVREIAAALDVIHAQGIVHLDLKPSNLLIGQDGVLRVLDFGIARMRDGGVVISAPVATEPLGTGALLDLDAADTGEGTSRSSMPDVVGTPGYMAPEVVEGREARPAADAYALGVCLFQLITGRLPQRSRPLPERGATSDELSAWRAEVRAATVTGELDDLSKIAPGTPRAVSALVRQLVTLDPGARPPPGSLHSLVTEAWSRPYGTPDPPYLGLRAYGAEAEGFLFGREGDAARLATELAHRPALVLQGASGSGKSSLAVAGVVPALARAFVDGCDDWVAAEVRPGQDIDAAVRRARAQSGKTVGVVLVVDQLEELVTQLSPDARARFVVALARWAAPGPGGNPTPAVRVLCTLREDFTTRVAALGTLAPLLESSVRFVPPPSAASVRDIVVGPAALAGVRVDDERPVVDDVLRELRAGEGRLPLLSIALAEWWAQRERNVLKAEAWRRIGGVAGALSRHADATLAALPPEVREAARRLCLSLVTPEGTRARLSVGDLRVDPLSSQVLDAFDAARLVAIDDVGSVSFSHEALLFAWATLAGWIGEERADRAEAAALATLAGMWNGAPVEGRTDLLLAGPRLARAEDLGRRRPDLAAPVADLLAASRRFSARGRRARTVLGTLGALGLIGAVAFGFVVNQQHEHDLRVREENLRTLSETGNRNAKAVAEANHVIAERNAEVLAARGDARACKEASLRLEQEHRAALAARYPADSTEAKLVTFLLAWEHAWNLHDEARITSFFAPDVEWLGTATPRDTLAKNLAGTWRKSPSNRLLLGEIAVVKRDGDTNVLRITRDERTAGASNLSVIELVVKGETPDSFAIARATVERTISSGKILGCGP